MATNLPGRHFVANLIRGRSLIFQLVRRDFEQRYIGSMMGWIWGLIHPLVLLGVYTFVFHYAITAPTGRPDQPSPANPSTNPLNITGDSLLGQFNIHGDTHTHWPVE